MYKYKSIDNDAFFGERISIHDHSRYKFLND